MTTGRGSSPPPAGSGGGAAGKVQQAAGQVQHAAGQAQQEATRLGHETAQAGGHTARQAVEQGRQVASEGRQQVRNLLGEASAQARTQAHEQQRRAAESLRSLGSQLRTMADGTEGGMAAEVVRRGADAAQQAAGWLDEREPGTLLREARDYASRHPGAFLAGAAIAGLLAGRLGRALTGGPDGQGGGGGIDTSRAEGFQPAGETPLRAPATPDTAAPLRHGPMGREVGP
ncbi:MULTISPECIES: hypothetical protein [unclassified Micromonospora]|uniref:hypothetical protein n=1 Tax=unclassified Micromonospora TaxID=2617518 RepID=UPI002FEE8734